MNSRWPPQYDPQNHPQAVLVKLPINSQVSSLDSKVAKGKHGENVVSWLYQHAGWDIVAERFRIKNSEIDLAAYDQKSKRLRIIEVKYRVHQDATLACADLLPSRKMASLRRGTKAIEFKLQRRGIQPVSCTVDLVLVTKLTTEMVRVCTWPEAFDL